MKEFKIYYSPFIEELRAMGFVPLKTSPDAQKLIFKAFTEQGHPYSRYMNWYMNRFGNTHDLTRKAIAIYAYGLSGNNLNQFGGDMRFLMFDIFINIIKSIMGRYCKENGKVGRVKFNRRHVSAFTNMMIDNLMLEALDQVRRAGGESVEWRGYKPPRKRAIRGDREYRIMRYADLYD